MGSSQSNTLVFHPNSVEQAIYGDITLSRTFYFEKYQVTVLFLRSKSTLYFYLDFLTSKKITSEFMFTISNTKNSFQTIFSFSTKQFLNSVVIPNNFINESETATIAVSITPLSNLEFTPEKEENENCTKINVCKLKDMKADNIFGNCQTVDVENGQTVVQFLSMFKNSNSYIPFIVFPGTDALIPVDGFLAFSNYKIPRHMLNLVLMPSAEGKEQQIYVTSGKIIGSYSKKSFKPVISNVFLADGPNDHSIVKVMPKKMSLCIDGEITKVEYNTQFKEILNLVKKDENTLLLVNHKIATRTQFPQAISMYGLQIETYQNTEKKSISEFIGANFITVFLYPLHSMMMKRKIFYFQGDRYIDIVKRFKIDGKLLISTRDNEGFYKILNENDFIMVNAFRVDQFLDDFLFIDSINDVSKAKNSTVVIEYAMKEDDYINSLGFIMVRSDDSINNLIVRITQEISMSISNDIRIYSVSGIESCTISKCNTLYEGICLHFEKSNERPIIIIHK